MLKKAKTEKANEFRGLILYKKYFSLLQQNTENEKSRAVHRFELSKRISQIDYYNHKENAFNAWYSWHINKKRLLAGQILLTKKRISRSYQRAYKCWENAHKKATDQRIKEDAINEEKINQFRSHIIKRKIFEAWKEFVNGGIRRLKREKLHSIFTEWKFQIKEKSLLRNYLKQCHIDEKYSQTPITTFRFDVPKLTKEPTIPMISPISSEKPKGNAIYYSPIKVSENKETNFPSSLKESVKPFSHK